MTPAVSVVMAAKNYAKFLPLAVESVLVQTHTDWELVIVDDGSTDATPDAVRPYLADKRIRYVRSDRLGQSRAKNLGARLARAELIAYLDADDIWMPTKLQHQLALLAANPTVGICYCRRQIIDEDGNRISQTSPAPLQFPRGDVLSAVFLKNFVCFSSVVVRKYVFDHIGGFDPEWDLSIDYDLWLRAARHYEFDWVDEELVQYRTGHGNLSKKLVDRVATATAIMNRTVSRRDTPLPPDLVAEGFASTFRSLAYELRASEPLTAASWYLRAMAWPGRRLAAMKGLAACGRSWIRGNRVVPSPENASVNL